MTMQKKKLLQETGLNSYEAAAYLSLLNFGVSEASTIHKDAEVPYGKIYSVLESLAAKGFVEIQNSRPKKFKAVEPETALNAFFEKRKVEVEKELETLQDTIDELKQVFKSMASKKKKDDVFWTTAVNEDDIKKFIKSIYSDAKRSVCIIPPPIAASIGASIINDVFTQFVSALERGVKVRMLASSEFINLISFLPINDEKTMDTLKKNLEIRTSKIIDSHAGIVDDNMVLLLQPHPLNKDRLLSVVKIWDSELARNLREEFDVMWKAGERIDVVEKIKMIQIAKK